MNSNRTCHAYKQAEEEVVCSTCGNVVRQQEALLLGLTDVADTLVELWMCEACLKKRSTSHE